jgi:two-component system cell cycle sensor histidine kinase/response regulator CckA
VIARKVRHRPCIGLRQPSIDRELVRPLTGPSMESLPSLEPDLLVATCGPGDRILSRNSAWEQHFGSGSSLWTALPAADRELARRNVKEALGGSLVTHALFMVPSKHRDIPSPVLLHFIPVPDAASGHSTAVTITGEILAEPTTWTESQTQRHRMETLGRMTMGMAHDFNNLLSGILGHLELWKLEQSPSAQVRQHLDTIEKAAMSGADLISRIQRYIRQEARSTFEPLQLNALVEDCIQFTRPYWYNEPRRQGINIETSLLAGILPDIHGSRAELRDVFVNLILNAIHAMPQGGSITVSTGVDAEGIRIDVTDTGTGMPEDVARRVFEPLFTTKGQEGNGMGLAVAAGTMREHGGSISVRSVLGKGTTFTLRFPIPRETEPTQATAPDDPGRSSTVSPRTILVVDDEEMVRNVICRLLQVRGHRATGVASAHEALDRLDEQAWDLVLTDQGMPGMTGRELAHQVRKRKPDLPILLLTGDTDIDVNPREINRVLTKPFRIQDVEAVIQSLT